ncbi:hypothetical protein KDK_27770 [Dictyobacter kobayashii]|uniref:Helicase HerA central domain-containing protein n=1 Tax=Dictyobacter kobayashii TaxID=2014872 RepID=A0A402AIM7_9CHLR|nr:hypothetical protein KDK_27770 [Dictyobacter kobayashii]
MSKLRGESFSDEEGSDYITEPKSERLPALPTDPYAAAIDSDVLQLGSIVETQERFDPCMDDLLGKGMLLAGSQGTGKSNIIGLVARSAGQIGMPFLIIDFKGEFYTLTDVVPNGIVAGHPDASDQFSGGFFPLTSENTAELAQILMEGPFQVILDVPSYNGDNDEVAAVIANLLHALMDWSKDIKRQGGDPWPCLVITDEAHNFLPERKPLSALVMQRPDESFGSMTKAYSRMANTGRSFGYTLLLATQRLPNIAKWSIANLQTKVILAHAEKNDLNACEVETGGLVDKEVIKRLQQGTGVVMGFTHDPIIVHFDKQLARHVSVTPKVAHLKKQFSHSRSQQQDISKFMSTKYQSSLAVNEYVNTPVEPVNDRECPVNIHEGEETINDQNTPKFTPEQSAEVLKAYGILLKSGQAPTRNALRIWLYENVSKAWNTSQKNYDVFKAICDEYGL